MSSEPTTSAKLPPRTEDDKVLGGRATDEERQLIDMAAAKLGVRRAHFIIAAALERAQQILKVNQAA